MLFSLEPIGPDGSYSESPGPLFVVAGGAPETASAKLLRAAPASARYLAADGGLRLLLELGRRPEALVGDLDSLDPEEVVRAERMGVEIERHPRDKDASDLELAILRAHRSGARRLTLLGCLGGQIDHTLVNLFAPLTLCSRLGIWARLLTAEMELYLLGDLSKGATVLGCRGRRLSLCALSRQVEGLSLKGLRYPLQDAVLRRRETRGLANVVESEQASITTSAGSLLICLLEEPRSPV